MTRTTDRPTSVEDFRKAAHAALEAGQQSSDLYDVAEILKRADAMSAEVRTIREKPPVPPTPDYDHADRTLADSRAILGRMVRQMVEGTLARTAAGRDAIRNKHIPAEPGTATVRDKEVHAYRVTLLEMDADRLPAEAEVLFSSLKPRTYPLAEVLIVELKHRGLAAAAEAADARLYAMQRAHLDDPAFIAAKDMCAKATAWLSEHQGDDPDPRLSVTFDGKAYTTRTSDLVVG